MSTDRELMELAATAVGVAVVRWNDGLEPYSSGLGFILDSGRLWNPLTDDGDALRLAVKLKMSVSVFDDAVGIGINPDFGYREYDISHDKNTSTRRAIVRAAAEIGKSMQP